LQRDSNGGVSTAIVDIYLPPSQVRLAPYGQTRLFDRAFQHDTKLPRSINRETGKL